MTLLILITLALLSLSAIETRATQTDKDLLEAQANARLALMIAIGDLQKTMGRDQFVSAPSGLLQNPSGTASVASHYTGVWAARENPRDEDAADALGKAPSYDSSTAFVQWLVSNTDLNLLQNESSDLTEQLHQPITMVGNGSTSANGHVIAGGVPVTSANGSHLGKYAWWVSENGTKALIRNTDLAMREVQSKADALLSFASPGTYGIETLDELNIKSNTPESDKLVTLHTADLLEGIDGSPVTSDRVKKHFHDITHHSKSLLTNVTTGGLRKDLSLFFEGAPEGGSWTGTVIGGNAPLGPYGNDALSPRNEFDVGHWKSLRQHYAMHKTAASTNSSELISGNIGETLNAVDDVRPTSGNQHPYPSWNTQRKLLKPTLVRLSYVLSVSVQDASRGRVSKEDLQKITPRSKPYDETTNKYLVTFHAFPVVCLWNPYNQNLKCPGFSVGNMGMSVEHDVTIGGSAPIDFQWIVHNDRNDTAAYHVHGMNVETPFTMKPGEVKMFFGSGDTYKSGAQHYTRGVICQDATDIDFDPSPGSSLFSAGLVQNGVIGATHDSGNPNYRGWEVLTGLFGSITDTIEIDTTIFTPQGSRASGSRADYNGLLYYATYSSMDVRMTSRSMSSWRSEALWWVQWGGGRNRHQASKWSNKIGWRNDEDNPVILGQPIKAFANISDLATGRKQPYMVVDLRLKSTGGDPDERNPNLVWLHNIPGHGYSGVSGQSMSETQVFGAGNTVTDSHARPYTVVYSPVQSANEAWNTLQLDSIEDELRSYFGNSYRPDGQHKAIAAEIPVAPLQSIAQLQHVPQTPTDATRWSGLSLQNYAIGNSYANPNISADQIRSDGWSVWLDTRVDNADHRSNQLPDLDGKKWHATVNGEGPPTEHFKPTKHLDRSYAANTLLWDDFYFSGMAAQTGSYFTQGLNGEERSLEDVVNGFTHSEKPLANARYKLDLLQKTPDTVGAELLGDENYRKSAAYISVMGGFNVNSTSKAAWKAFFASNLKKKTVTLTNDGKPNGAMEESTATEYIVSRYSLASGEGHESSSNSNKKWLGYRIINDDDLDDLAEKMVEQVKLRGPFRSIGEFINRRLEQESDLALRGALQSALDHSSINSHFTNDPITEAEINNTDYAYKDAALLSRHAGTPPYMMQGDLLQSIGSAIQVRSDTFTIRAYGESSDGKTKVWCEAVVQRDARWTDESDPVETEYNNLTDINKMFGRRLNIVSFRWLSPSEI
ncbi:hypothetical protein [Oceaniferula spumae]